MYYFSGLPWNFHPSKVWVRRFLSLNKWCGAGPTGHPKVKKQVKLNLTKVNRRRRKSPPSVYRMPSTEQWQERLLACRDKETEQKHCKWSSQALVIVSSSSSSTLNLGRAEMLPPPKTQFLTQLSVYLFLPNMEHLCSCDYLLLNCNMPGISCPPHQRTTQNALTLACRLGAQNKAFCMNLMFLVDEKNAENGRKGCQCRVIGKIQLQKRFATILTNQHDDLLPSSIAKKSWM